MWWLETCDQCFLHLISVSRCFFCSVLKTVGFYAGELNKNLIVVSLYVINQCEMTKPDDLCVDMPVKLHTETS